MKVDIDLSADAALMVWGERAKGRSQQVDVPGRGVRLLLSEVGDVVGVEVLGWSHRTDSPSEVVMTIAGPGQVLDETDPLAAALAGFEVEPLVTNAANRPIGSDGKAMRSVVEVAAALERSRSWVTRALSAGKIDGQKIGNEWWVRADQPAVAGLDEPAKRAARKRPAGKQLQTQ